jgi:hypothetical protein
VTSSRATGTPRANCAQRDAAARAGAANAAPGSLAGRSLLHERSSRLRLV